MWGRASEPLGAYIQGAWTLSLASLPSLETSMSASPTSILEKNTAAWRIQVWVSFAVSVGATAGACLYLDVDIWQRAFMLLGVLFTVSSTLALAKTVRDDHEADKLLNRADAARTEKLISTFAA